MLKTYTSDRVSMTGEVDVEVSANKGGGKKVLPLLVVKDEGPSLLG